MQTLFNQTQTVNKEELVDIAKGANLDIRMVSALAGDRQLNEREKAILERLLSERGDGFYTDLIYALTHHAFPSKQAKKLWGEIIEHRATLKQKLGRDVGISVSTHDYLTNVSQLLKGVTLIEEIKMTSIATTANKDGLTGLYDQATFKHRLREELERQVRYGGTLSVVMFDIDHFKKINDAFGHAEGDTVLQKVSNITLQHVRTMDTVARYGGEEFAIILPEVNASNAYTFAERLRHHIEASFKESGIPVTISAGLSECASDGSSTFDDLIRSADSQLYRAKEHGRNQVQWSGITA